MSIMYNVIFMFMLCRYALSVEFDIVPLIEDFLTDYTFEMDTMDLPTTFGFTKLTLQSKSPYKIIPHNLKMNVINNQLVLQAETLTVKFGDQTNKFIIQADHHMPKVGGNYAVMGHVVYDNAQIVIQFPDANCNYKPAKFTYDKPTNNIKIRLAQGSTSKVKEGILGPVESNMIGQIKKLVQTEFVDVHFVLSDNQAHKLCFWLDSMVVADAGLNTDGNRRKVIGSVVIIGAIVILSVILCVMYKQWNNNHQSTHYNT